ncbi:hypothetical protein [Spirulina major]|uniref:hypothetical protein n=1 Tax=Spirulina major TaxID=270636 RepID=UPI0015874DC8|nr:hypothetical protein [Spirulina major]
MKCTEHEALVPPLYCDSVAIAKYSAQPSDRRQFRLRLIGAFVTLDELLQAAPPQ